MRSGAKQEKELQNALSRRTSAFLYQSLYFQGVNFENGFSEVCSKKRGGFSSFYKVNFVNKKGLKF